MRDLVRSRNGTVFEDTETVKEINLSRTALAYQAQGVDCWAAVQGDQHRGRHLPRRGTGAEFALGRMLEAPIGDSNRAGKQPGNERKWARQNIHCNKVRVLGAELRSGRANHGVDVEQRADLINGRLSAENARLKEKLVHRTEEQILGFGETQQVRCRVGSFGEWLLDDRMQAGFKRLLHEGFVSLSRSTDVNNVRETVRDDPRKVRERSCLGMTTNEQRCFSRVAIRNGGDRATDPRYRVRMPPAHEAGADDRCSQSSNRLRGLVGHGFVFDALPAFILAAETAESKAQSTGRKK